MRGCDAWQSQMGTSNNSLIIFFMEERKILQNKLYSESTASYYITKVLVLRHSYVKSKIEE